MEATRLAAETIQSAALAFESVDDIEGRHGLALSVLGVCDSVTDDVLEEGFEDTTGLFVNHCGRDALGTKLHVGQTRTWFKLTG